MVSSLYWTFGFFDVGALLLLVSELTSHRGLSKRVRLLLPPWAAVSVLVVAYLCQVAVTAFGVFTQPAALPHAFVPMPLRGAIASHEDLAVAALLGLACIQTYALLSIYRKTPGSGVILCGAAIVWVVSLASPIMVTDDIYAYIGDALLGKLAYAPPALPFQGSFALINVWWPPPMPPTPYGPAWLIASWLFTAPFGSLLGKAIGIRVLGAVSFGALLLILRALRMPPRMIAVAALNTGIAFEYVASGHNDLFGIVLLCGAALAVRRPAIAALFVIAGGLVKLPFAFFGLPLLVRVKSKAARLIALVTVPAAAAALTFAAGGAGYYRALLPHTTTTPVMMALSGSVALAVIVCTIAAIFSVRRLRSVVWLTPLAASYTLSSYAIWGLPYALTRRNVLSYLLVAFPLATTLVEIKFTTIWSLFIVVPVVFAWQALAIRDR